MNAPATKPRPRSLILRPWEVLAALRAAERGEFWQVRRILKWDGLEDVPPTDRFCEEGQAPWEETSTPGIWIGCNEEGSTIFARCPLGAPGDVLAFREAWAAADRMEDGFEREEGQCIAYRADLSALRHLADVSVAIDVSNWNWEHPCVRWRSPAQMPAWAVRLTMPVAEVRCERAKQATEADALEMGLLPVTSLTTDCRDAAVHANARAMLAGSDRAAWDANVYQFIARGKPEVRRG